MTRSPLQSDAGCWGNERECRRSVQGQKCAEKDGTMSGGAGILSGHRTLSWLMHRPVLGPKTAAFSKSKQLLGSGHEAGADTTR